MKSHFYFITVPIMWLSSNAYMRSLQRLGMLSWICERVNGINTFIIHELSFWQQSRKTICDCKIWGSNSCSVNLALVTSIAIARKVILVLLTFWILKLPDFFPGLCENTKDDLRLLDPTLWSKLEMTTELLQIFTWGQRKAFSAYRYHSFTIYN